MGEIKFITSLLLISVFSISILSYAIMYGSENDADIKITDDPEFNNSLNNIKTELITFNPETNASSKAFFESEIAEGSDSIKTGGAFKVGMGTLLSSVTLVADIIFLRIFGNDVAFGILITAFTSLLVYIGFRYILQTWTGRSP